MPSPFNRDDIWAKAKNFINRSFDARDDGDFATAAMWAAFALELLGKAALSHKNPCLIADPSDDGRSLMVAAGLSNDFTRAKSVPAKAVFSRCKAAFPPVQRRRGGSDREIAQRGTAFRPHAVRRCAEPDNLVGTLLGAGDDPD
jgi:hypothetical protein